MVKTAGVANHRRDVKRSFTIQLNNPKVYVSQWKLHWTGRRNKVLKISSLASSTLVTAISTQIFSVNTIILLALHYVKKFLYLDLTYPGVYWVITQYCQRTLVWPDFKRLTHRNTSSAWVAVQVYQLVLLCKLMVENKIKNHTRKVNKFQKIIDGRKKLLSFQSINID